MTDDQPLAGRAVHLEPEVADALENVEFSDDAEAVQRVAERLRDL